MASPAPHWFTIYTLTPDTYTATLTVTNDCGTIEIPLEVEIEGCPELVCCPNTSSMLLVNTLISESGFSEFENSQNGAHNPGNSGNPDSDLKNRVKPGRIVHARRSLRASINNAGCCGKAQQTKWRCAWRRAHLCLTRQ